LNSNIIEIVRSEARYRRADAETATAFGLDPTETHSDSESGAVASFLDYSGTVIVAAGPDLREPVSRDPRMWIGCCGVRVVTRSLTLPKTASEPRYSSQ
jgi:hypothetical protein